jgi:hypothetical protein
VIAPTKRRTLSIVDADVERSSLRKASIFHSSLTGESDESDDDDELYVQTPWPPYKFGHEDLRRHLNTYQFKAHSHVLLETVVKNGRLLNPSLFPECPAEEKWHNSHYSVFDVGVDGALLSRREVVKDGTTSIDSAIWQAIQVTRPRRLGPQLLLIQRLGFECGSCSTKT